MNQNFALWRWSLPVIAMPLISIFIQAIPEGICTFALFFVLLRLRLDWLKIVALSLIFAFLSYLVRLLPLVPGEPTIIIIILCSIAVAMVDKQHSYVKILFVVVITTAILAVLEALLFPLSLNLLHVTLEHGKQHPLLWSLAGLAHVIVGFIIVAGLNFYYDYRDRKNAALPAPEVIAVPSGSGRPGGVINAKGGCP